jgi:hypothetical protein
VSILKDTIEQIVELNFFNQELAAEWAESAKIIAMPQRSAEFFGSLCLK